MRRTIILSISAVLLGTLAWFVFKPVGLLWFFRTYGWDSWSKVLDGTVTQDGAVEFPVNIKWDFVDLYIAPKPQADLALTQQIIIRIINESKQSLSVLCQRKNEEKGLELETIVHEITDSETILVFKGSWTEFHSKWGPIGVSRPRERDRINVLLSIESEDGRFEAGAIPFTVEAKWWSYGF